MAAMSALLPLLMPGAASFAGGGSYHPAGPSGASEAWTEPVPATKQACAVNWKLEKTTGEKPAPRGAGKWIPVGNKIVAIGGFYECFDKTKCDHTYYDDVFIFDTKTNKWEKKNPRSADGAMPGKRVFMGAAPYKKRKTAIIFGGASYNATVSSLRMYNDMWEYNPETDVMTQVKYANQGPVPRLGAELAIKDDTAYLFGGYDQDLRNHNDLWSFNLESKHWQQLRKDDDTGSPSKRYIFRFVLDEPNQDLYIFGGNFREKRVTVQRKDVWKYNIPANSFTAVVSEKDTNVSGRTHGAAAVFGGHFIIAMGDIPDGGCFTNQDSEHQYPTNEVWSLQTGKPGSLWNQVKIGEGPPPLKRVFYATVGDKLYLTLGFNYKCDNPETAGPSYNTNTYSLDLRQIK